MENKVPTVQEVSVNYVMYIIEPLKLFLVILPTALESSLLLSIGANEGRNVGHALSEDPSLHLPEGIK